MLTGEYESLHRSFHKQKTCLHFLNDNSKSYYPFNFSTQCTFIHNNLPTDIETTIRAFVLLICGLYTRLNVCA